jgi:murein L,D-transpeptidase YcbB/YkuD
VQAFVDDVDGPDDDGQMDMFVRFVEADPRLLKAIREGDWDTWETVYNGGGYGGAYAEKIRAWLRAHGDAPAVPRLLKRGDRGADVAQLQRALGVQPDGDFGPTTDAAVRLAQQHFGLVVDGLVGVMTLRALGLAA